MLRSIGLTLIFFAVSAYASAVPTTSQVPEIDPNSAIGALALLGGGFMVLKARRQAR